VRPLQLNINAFGPYPGYVSLDFTSFHDSSIFLVSGPTGAGKTTIFDALAYALFDEASGDTRDKDTFKSQFATDTDLCYVELKFELNGKTYYVKRVPKQKGPGKTGKPINVDSSVEFHHPYGQTTKIKKANKEIVELIGLTYDQFQQIVMLPQGQFKKMLESNSGDKEKIFRNIFKTDRLESFQNELKNKYKELRKEFEKFEDSLKQAFNSVETQGDENLDKAIEQFETPLVVDKLSQMIDLDQKELDKLNRKTNKLQSEKNVVGRIIESLKKKAQLTNEINKLEENQSVIDDYSKQIENHDKAQILLNLRNQLDETNKDLFNQEESLKEHQQSVKGLMKQLGKAKKSVQEAEKKATELPKKRDYLAGLKTEIQIFDRVTQLKDKQDTSEKTISEKEKLIETQQKEMNKLNEEKDTVEKNLEKVEQWRREKDEKIAGILENEKALTNEEQRLKQIKDIKQSRETVLQNQEAMIQAEEEYNQANLEYEKARSSFYRNIAGVLATDLKKNNPCPVCGSTHHPNSAHQTTEDITKKEYDHFDRIATEKYGVYTKAKSTFEQNAEYLKNQLRDLNLNANDLAEEIVEQEKLVQQYKDTLKELKEKRKQLETNLSKEKTWRDDLNRINEEIQAVSKKIDSAQTEIKQSRKQMGELNEEIKIELNKLHFASKEDVTKAIGNEGRTIEKIEKDLNTSKEKLNNLTNKEASLNQSIEMTKQQIKTLTERKNSQKQTFKEKLDESDLSKDFQDKVLEESVKTRYEDKIVQHKEELAGKRAQINDQNNYLETINQLKSLNYYEKREEEIKEQLPEVKNSYDKVLTRINQNQKAYNEIKGYLHQSKEIERKVATYGELSNYANGTKETGYISFERYVLGIYFEEILQAANVRFALMTNNRYLLERKDHKSKGSGPQGLDVNVFDHYTGKERSVNTLSGGETFKASLSLALGLSDVIQNKNGGVSVDMLFIDEGFGTLDSDSLDSAIQTLLDLNKNNRLVGIISHVEELKTRISSHIIVEKTQIGSTATIKT